MSSQSTFSKENIKRLQDTTQRIQNIFDICDEFGKISLALTESKKAQPAIKQKIDSFLENLTHS